MNNKMIGEKDQRLVISYKAADHKLNDVLSESDQKCLEFGRMIRLLSAGVMQQRRATVYECFLAARKLKKLIGGLSDNDVKEATAVVFMAFPSAPNMDDDAAAEFVQAIDSLSDLDLRLMAIGLFTVFVRSFGAVADAKVVDDTSGLKIAEGMLMTNWWLQLLEYLYQRRPKVFEGMGVYSSLFDPPKN